MTANSICCYSNEANDGDVVIEFHTSRLDGCHWSDLLGQGKRARLGGLISLAKEVHVDRKLMAGESRQCGQIVPLQNGKDNLLLSLSPELIIHGLLGFLKNYLRSNCE